jgi:hypothetical protein
MHWVQAKNAPNALCAPQALVNSFIESDCHFFAHTFTFQVYLKVQLEDQMRVLHCSTIRAIFASTSIAWVALPVALGASGRSV